ncbi:hypothetical protein Tco_1392446 [Tanacetum coccineum]
MVISTTPLDALTLRTRITHAEDRKRKKTLVNGRNKGKEKVFEDEDTDKRQRKLWLMEGVVKTRRDRGVVISDGGFNNVGGKEEVVCKRGVQSRKMQGTSVK